MFGFLRRLLMAGDIKGVLDGSRRALRELSPEIGERSSRTAEEFLRSRGVDVPNERFQAVVPPWSVSEGFSNRAPLRFPLGEEGLPVAFTTTDMRGNALYIDPNTGRRLSVNPNMLRPGYSPIEAPYEGIRPLREYSDDDSWGTVFAPAGPYVGRGRPTRSARLWDQESSPYGPGTYDWHYGYVPNNVMNLEFGPPSRPMWPWESMGIPQPMRQPRYFPPPLPPSMDPPF